MSTQTTRASTVTFDDISVRYGSRTAIEGISATIAAGDVAGIIGPNGCGKSTLLSLLTGHHPHFTGTVSVDGQDITTMPARDRARRIGVLRQHAGPLPDVTVEELITLGPHTLPRSQLAKSIARVGLEEIAHEPVAALSGGQLQRALLARAIRHDPSLLILDEPTNHLDVQHKFALMLLLRELGVTVLCALHDLDLAARYSDDLLLLTAGRLRSQGRPAEVLSPPEVFAAFGVRGEMITSPRGDEHLLLHAAATHKQQDTPRQEQDRQPRSELRYPQ